MTGTQNKTDDARNEGDLAITKRRRDGRGWGPFTSRQLTTIVCVAIVAAVAIPTAAMAAVGTFTSTTVTPAVTATNSATVANARGVQGSASATSAGVNRWGVTGNAGGTFGIGVQGTGTKYGVFSNGNLGVAAGKSLSCTDCVSPTNLSAAAKAIQPLASGQSESGVYGVAGGNATGGLLMVTIPYSRPLAAPIAVGKIIDTGAGANANCPGVGSALPGYLCLYPSTYANVVPGGVGNSETSGAVIGFSVVTSPPITNGRYTLTAP